MYNPSVMDNLLTLTINSTHFYLIDCQRGKLLVDAGWELAQFTSQMKAFKISFNQIRYVMFTHARPAPLWGGEKEELGDFDGTKCRQNPQTSCFFSLPQRKTWAKRDAYLPGEGGAGDAGRLKFNSDHPEQTVRWLAEYQELQWGQADHPPKVDPFPGESARLLREEGRL